MRPQVVDEWRLTAFGGLKTTLWRIVDIVTIRYSCKKIFFSFYLESFRSRSPDRTTPFLTTNHPANTPDSPESPRFILRESPPDQPVAVEEAPVFEGAAG